MLRSNDCRRLTVATLLGMAVLALAAPASAQWVWKDDNGRVVYSDRPPPAGVKSDRIVHQPANSQTVIAPSQASAPTDAPARASSDAKTVPVPNAPRSAAEQEMEFRKRQIERADAEKKAQEEQTRGAVRAADCERAKGYLKAIEEGQRIARTDASGNREFLDDSQRPAEAERARKVVQSACNPPG